MSRNYVFGQFVISVEFANLCRDYGIERGAVTLTEERDKNYDVTRFVARNYTQFLGRAYETDGFKLLDRIYQQPHEIHAGHCAWICILS